jgi:hypothetical protein
MKIVKSSESDNGYMYSSCDSNVFHLHDINIVLLRLICDMFEERADQNHRLGERPTRSSISLKLSDTIDPSAVDDLSFTGVPLIGKLKNRLT